MKSMFAVDAEAKILQANPIPKFTKIARKFVEKIREELGGNEIRALAANQVASPVLQVRMAPSTRVYIEMFSRCSWKSNPTKECQTKPVLLWIMFWWT